VDCTCGVELKQYWIWRDENGALHASHFPPTSGLERSVLAATAREALIPFTSASSPRHQVVDANDLSIGWGSRCASEPEAVTTSPESERREPASVR
jgi:hypothetical protein